MTTRYQGRGRRDCQQLRIEVCITGPGAVAVEAEPQQVEDREVPEAEEQHPRFPSPDEILEALREGAERALTQAGRIEALQRKFALTPAEVSELLGVGCRTLENWRSQARGPGYVKEGKVILYPVAQLRSYLDASLQLTMPIRSRR